MGTRERAGRQRLRVIEGAAGGEVHAARAGASAATAEALAAAETPSPLGEVAPWPAAPPSRARAERRALLGELDDGELVALGASGDVEACEQLYRRHAPAAFNLATRIAGSSRDVEDVVHDAFLRAFDGLGELRNPSAFRHWLGAIVVHTMRSRLRRQRLLRLFGLGQPNDPIDLESIASPEAPPAARAELAQIYALLQTLPPDERIAWTLRFVEGHDLRSTADLAGCSLATIKRKIRAAQSYLELHFVDSSRSESEP